MSDAERENEPLTVAEPDTGAGTGEGPPDGPGVGSDDAAVAPRDRRLGERRARERRVHTVDFSQPTKFSSELRRRIVRALTPFCEAFAMRLSSELRTPVEIAIADEQQLTWSAAKAPLPADAVAVALEVAPAERQMLLNVDLPIILRALECLLGGSPSQAPAARRLSEIDWALTRPLLEDMAAQLTGVWRDLGGLRLEVGAIDVEGDAGVAAPLGEPTFAVTMEVRIDGMPANMSLFIPWSAIATVVEEIVGGGAHREQANPADGLAVQRGLAVASVLLRAEVGSTRLPVEQMLALTPGAVLELDDQAEGGVQVFAERVPLGRAHPGLRGARRAIKLVTPLEPGRAPLMPTAAAPQLGRSALLGEAERVAGELAGAPGEQRKDGAAPHAGIVPMMQVPVRVSAELGRTTLPLGSTLDVPSGTVLELEQSADAPIELFANGRTFAYGALQVSRDGRWAVQIEALA